MSSTYPDPGTVPFTKLKARHEKRLDALRAELSVPFQRRAERLVKMIQKELPNVGGLVYCNGDSWLVPVDYPKDRESGDVVTWRRADPDDPDGPTYTERLRNLLDSVGMMDEGDDRPDVSDRCLGHLRELFELCLFCTDEYTLNVPTTI